MFRRLSYFIFLLIFVSNCYGTSKRGEIVSLIDSTLSYRDKVTSLVGYSEADLEIVLGEENSKERKIILLNALCWKYFRTNPNRAHYYAKHLLIFAETTVHQEAKINAFDSYGYLSSSMGDYKTAISYLLKSIKIKEAIKDSMGLIYGYEGVANIYLRLNNYKEALRYFNASLHIEEILKLKHMINTTLQNIAVVYVDMGLIDKGLKQYYKALNNALTDNNESAVAILYNNIGQVYASRGNLSEALEMFLKACVIAEKISDRTFLSTLYTNIGDCFLKTGRYEESLIHYKKSIRLAKEMKNKEDEAKAYESISLAYSKLNNYKSAYNNHLNYSNIKDSIMSEASNRAIAEMSTKYQTDKKEKQIEIQNLSLGKQQVELKKRQIIIYSVLLGLLLVIALALSTYRNLRKNKRKNEIISAQKLEVEQQKHVIEEKHKEITDSIKYAKRLQEAIMPPMQLVNDMLPDCFVLFKPKDVVSGDFYWFEQKDNRIYFAAADCTGHGVPGAFMSIVNYNLLKHSINEHNRITPSEILMQVNLDLSLSLRQEYHESTIKDGMDISLCCFDKKAGTLEFAGANNSIYVVSGNGEQQIANREQGVKNNDYCLLEYKADKQPIGTFVGEEFKPFTNKVIDVKNGDMVFLFTDGYADQFGGPKGKKFMYKRFEELLRANSHVPVELQKRIYSNAIDEWKGEHEQVDDILLIGVRINKA